MSAFKHTPRPWTANQIQIGQGLPYTPVVATTLIAKVYSTSYGDHEQSAANALLMAAAPELLVVAHDFHEALQELGLLCECGQPDCRTTRLRSAIAKAGGAS
jgi:hypothetical protein